MSVGELEAMAATIRCDIINMICAAGEGHPGGSLSVTDVVTALYFRLMRVDPQDPRWPDRDRFILSKGHACPAWYSALAERGYFDKAHLGTLRKLNSLLQGHPDMKTTPGVDFTAGSLGQGISAGLGMAMAAKLHGKDYHVWVVIGDGECQEGSVWETALAAAKWQVDNMTVILDRNGLQNDDLVPNIMPDEPMADKWRAFGWRVIEIDGHDMVEIVETLEHVQTLSGQPTIVIAHTVKGKGVSFMEGIPIWHGRAPCEEEAACALEEIRRCACE
jgi:transketolase